MRWIRNTSWRETSRQPANQQPFSRQLFHSPPPRGQKCPLDFQSPETVIYIFFCFSAPKNQRQTKSVESWTVQLYFSSFRFVLMAGMLWVKLNPGPSFSWGILVAGGGAPPANNALAPNFMIPPGPLSVVLELCIQGVVITRKGPVATYG